MRIFCEASSSRWTQLNLSVQHQIHKGRHTTYILALCVVQLYIEYVSRVVCTYIQLWLKFRFVRHCSNDVCPTPFFHLCLCWMLPVEMTSNSASNISTTNLTCASIADSDKRIYHRRCRHMPSLSFSFACLSFANIGICAVGFLLISFSIC